MSIRGLAHRDRQQRALDKDEEKEERESGSMARLTCSATSSASCSRREASRACERATPLSAFHSGGARSSAMRAKAVPICGARSLTSLHDTALSGPDISACHGTA